LLAGYLGADVAAHTQKPGCRSKIVFLDAGVVIGFLEVMAFFASSYIGHGRGR